MLVEVHRPKNHSKYIIFKIVISSLEKIKLSKVDREWSEKGCLFAYSGKESHLWEGDVSAEFWRKGRNQSCRLWGNSMLGRENSKCKDPEEAGSETSDGLFCKRAETWYDSDRVVPQTQREPESWLQTQKRRRLDSSFNKYLLNAALCQAYCSVFRGFSNEQNSHIPIYVELNIVYIGWDTYDKLTKIYAMIVGSK